MIYPRHLGIIADGNRTWAKKQGLTPMDGHFAGAKHTIEMVQHIFLTTDIKVVTGWFLSTENLTQRPEAEIAFICGIYKTIGNDLDAFMQEHNINFRWVGNPEGLPQDFIDFLRKKQEMFTFPESDRTTVFAINYGGRDEIIRGIKSLSEEEKATLTEETFTKHLDFGSIEPLDMVIRTKGDQAHRTSGFMSRWIGYAELYFAEECYPAFGPEELEKSLQWYNSIADQRNFGK